MFVGEIEEISIFDFCVEFAYCYEVCPDEWEFKKNVKFLLKTLWLKDFQSLEAPDPKMECRIANRGKYIF